MEPIRLWAAVSFTACNGSTNALLSLAAKQGLHLYGLVPTDGGFNGHCAAWNYRPLSVIARKNRVRLRLQKKQGLFFRLRPLLHRSGLWLGGLLFFILLVYSQQFVWTVDHTTLSTGQAARSAAILRQVGLQPGDFVTQSKLTTGEYALLQSGEFSWASINFSKGRLEVEAAAIVPKPAIASGDPQGIYARCNGVVLQTNLVSGTLLVLPGQTVEAGQALIGTTRTDRSGSPILVPASGTVLAQIQWPYSQQIFLRQDSLLLSGRKQTQYTLTAEALRLTWPLKKLSPAENALAVTRHFSLELFGLPLPFSIEEVTYYEQCSQTISRTEQQALELARLQSQQALFAAFPDAEILAVQESWNISADTLDYNATYTVCADICT